MKDLVTIILRKLRNNDLRMNHEIIERLVYGNQDPLKCKKAILRGLKETGNVDEYDWEGLEYYLSCGDLGSDIEYHMGSCARKAYGKDGLNIREAIEAARQFKPCRAMQTYIKYYDDAFGNDYPLGILIESILEK